MVKLTMNKVNMAKPIMHKLIMAIIKTNHEWINNLFKLTTNKVNMAKLSNE